MGKVGTNAIDPEDLKVRARAHRWAELRDLLARVDALLATNIHIDMLVANKRDVVEEVAQFDKDRDRISRAIYKESSTVTVDALNADMRHKLTKEKRK